MVFTIGFCHAIVILKLERTEEFFMMNQALTFAKRTVIATLLSFLPAIFTATGHATNVSFAVRDANGQNLSGATLYVIRFSTTGPDAAMSVMAAQLTDGTTTLDLVNGIGYEVFASSQGYGPSARNQMFNPEHPHIDPNTVSGTVIVVLHETLSDRGIITAQITNGTPNSMLFGNVRKISTGRDVQFAACRTDGTGNCDMVFHNIQAAASGNTYDVSAYDPLANSGVGRGNGGQLSSPVVANQNVNFPLDMSGGLPPDRSANEGSQSFDQQQRDGETVSVEGVVEDINDASKIVPWAHIEVKQLGENGNKFNRFGTNSGENGRFRIYGLEVGTTYFLQVFGSCRQDGVCYDGYEATGTAMGINDFLYDSSATVKTWHVKLSSAATGNFVMPVQVKDSNGRILPGSYVSVWADGNHWHTDPSVTPICDGNWHNVDVSSPAFVNKNQQATTGYTLITGLRPGNYNVQAWSRFGNGQGVPFNAGPDGIWNWGPQGGGNNHRGCFSGSQDDLRLTIEENGAITVYNTSGAVVMANLSSVTVTVPVTINAGGVVQGTLTFPTAVDLRSDPITIILTDCSNNGCTGNFDVVGDNETPNQSSYNYSIQLSTSNNNQPANYRIEVISNYWGVVRVGHGEDRVYFNGTDAVTKNFTFAPAGRATGKLYKPDGSLFQPGQQATGGYLSGSVNARGVSVEAWAYREILQDGSYIIGGLLPGEYQLIPQVWGGSDISYSAPDDLPRVVVKANTDSYKDLKFVSGEFLAVDITNINDLPPLASFVDPEDEGRGYSGEYWEAQRLPAGTALSAEIIGQILDEGFGQNARFPYLPPVGNNGGMCGPNWPGGFCPQRIPSNAAIDVYMFRKGDLSETMNTYMYLTLIDERKNVAIDRAHTALPQIFVHGSSVTPVHVDFAPSGITSGVTVAGTVVAANIFRRVDFEGFGGSFENFIRFIPVVALYDGEGNFRSAGFVTPPPAMVGEDSATGRALDAAITAGDYDAFIAITDGMTWGYQIRGVPPSKTYSLIATTPNYPPYTAKLTVGVDNSTTTHNFNWDTAVGAGATLTGVVRSTGNVVIPNASVVIKTEAIKKKTIVTDSSGAYKAEGLPLGTYKITVTADGYAPLKKVQEVTSAASVTVNFVLTAAPGSISGTVRELTLTSRGPVVKPVSGAEVVAYDDTFNVANPNEPLALIKGQTDSNGEYQLLGLIPGDVYKIFVKAPGRYIESISTQAALAPIIGVDFNLKQKPLEVQVFARPNPPNYEFIIANPNNFEEGQVWYGPVGNEKQNDISNNFSELPDGSLIGTIPLSVLNATTTYVLHIEAVPADGSPLVVKELQFGRNVNANAEQPIDDVLIGDDSEDDAGRPGNRVGINNSGRGASLDVTAGSTIQTSTADVPSLIFTEISTSALAGGQAQFEGEFKGSVFELGFSSVQFTGRQVILNLAYDPQAVDPAELDDLVILYYNPSTGEWERVVGQVTLDPLNGIIQVLFNPAVQIQAQSNIAQVNSGNRKSTTMKAAATKKQYLVNPLAASTGSGAFTVGVLASTGAANASGTYKQYNFPNPFNLQTKTVNLRSGSSVATSIRGTYIVIAPTGSGNTIATIRIYNMAGDMVRELKDTVAGNQYNYFHWDGKNTAGEDVASGVYFATVDAPGSDKEEPIKMVVVK